MALKIAPKTLSKIPQRLHGTNTRLTVCVLSRDNYHTLATTLQSVARLADEIIIIDANPILKPLEEVAPGFDAKIYQVHWNNNFSELRNFSLEQATGHWVLSLDADEALSPDSAHLVQQLIECTPISPLTLFSIKISHLNEGGHPCFEDYSIRLFPKHPMLEWQGAQDEFLKFQDNTPYSIEFIKGISVIRVRPIVKKSTNSDRFLMLKDHLTQAPMDPIAHYNMGRYCFDTEQWATASKHFAQSIEFMGVPEDASIYAQKIVPEAYYFQAESILKTGNLHAANVVVNDGLIRAQWYPDLWHVAAKIAFAQERYENCLQLCTPVRLLHKLSNHTDIIARNDVQIQTWKNHVLAGHAAWELKNFDKTRTEYRAALLHMPEEGEHFQVCLERLMEIDFKQQNLSGLASLMPRYLGLANHDPELFWDFVDAYYEQEGAYALYEVLTETIERLPHMLQEQEVRMLLAKIAIESHRPGEALQHYEAVKTSGCNDVRFVACYGQLLMKMGHYQKAVQLFDQAMVSA